MTNHFGWGLADVFNPCGSLLENFRSNILFSRAKTSMNEAKTGADRRISRWNVAFTPESQNSIFRSIHKKPEWQESQISADSCLGSEFTSLNSIGTVTGHQFNALLSTRFHDGECYPPYEIFHQRRSSTFVDINACIS